MASIHNPLSPREQGLSVSWEMWPLNQNRRGEFQKYGHPVLLRPADRKEDVYGYCGDLYCPNCGSKSDFMLLEFQEPSAEFLAAWMNLDPKEIDEDLLRCPKCGRSDQEPA